MNSARDILDFWFVEHGQKDWFSSSPEFDAHLREKFFDLHGEVAVGEASSWRKTAQGRVAEIIVLDQFSRQFFRGKSKAFASDSMSLVLAQELVSSGLDKSLTTDQRMFAYMPFMHSESLLIHETAAQVFTELGDENAMNSENSHREILLKFGRYPKRNAALGRASTKEELEYINSRQGEHF